MFSPLDASAVLGDPGPWLSDYLDHLCAPLIGVLPFEERARLRLEVRLHVEALAEEHAARGLSPDEALAAAMREFGEPWVVGETILREAAHYVDGRSGPGAAVATVHGLVWLGLPSAASLMLITEVTVDNSGRPLPLLALLTLLTPIAGGALSGLTAPVDAEAGVCRALGVVAMFSLGVGTLLLPSLNGMALLGLQAAYWLPAAWLSARAAVWARRQYRRSRFLRHANLQAYGLPTCEGG
jgi:hypothetical protein